MRSDGAQVGVVPTNMIIALSKAREDDRNYYTLCVPTSSVLM